MTHTPVFDQLLTEEGPPLVTRWEVAADGTVDTATEPRLDTQFAVAFAMDSMNWAARREVQRAVEERSREWWLAATPVPPVVHEHYQGAA